MTASKLPDVLPGEVEDWPQVPVLEDHHFLTEPMESEHHLLALVLFYTLMKEAFAGRDDVFVGADLVCYFSDLQVKNKDFRAPDGMVVLGVEPRERKGWIVWQEGGRYPDLAVEHMSPTTRAVDLGKKLAIYGNIWKVREYYAFDLDSGALHAFHREGDALVPAQRDAAGLVDSRVLGARVGVAHAPWNGHPGPFLRTFDAAGALVPTLAEVADSERGRADAERARADAEKARADALEAELRALRGQS